MKRFQRIPIGILARFLSLLFFALVLADVRAESAFERAVKSDPQTVFSGLKNGAFLENLVFRRVYKHKNTAEDAIVVTVPQGSATTGVVVYTQNGRLFVRHPALGKIGLTGFAPEDLLTDGPEIEAAVRTLYAKRAQPVKMTELTTEAQLARAYELLHEQGDFPCARTEAPFALPNPDATTTLYPPGSVVFDWNGTHYFYHPDLGVRGQPIPLDPVTGQPYLCVNYGDVVESVAFYYAYLKTHPGEQATLLAPMPPPRQGKAEPGDTSRLTWAAVAYTKKGQLYLRSHILGDVQLEQYTAADLNKSEALHAAYKQLLRAKLKAKRKATGSAPALPRTVYHVAAELGTAIPSSLPGDDADMQLRRVCLALKNLNGNTKLRWVSQPAPDGVDVFHFLLIFCEDKAFQYSSSYPTVHRRYRDRSDPSPLVAGLLYNLAYQKAHPTEKTGLVFPPEANNTGAVALQTKNGQTQYYRHLIGSFPLPSVAPDDWTNPSKRTAILAAARQVILDQHQPEWDNRQKISAAELAREEEEDKQFEAANVYQVFRDAGITCQLVSTERTWGEDGRFTELPVPTLIFEWAGATYTYNAFHLCARTTGYFPVRFRLE